MGKFYIGKENFVEENHIKLYPIYRNSMEKIAKS